MIAGTSRAEIAPALAAVSREGRVGVGASDMAGFGGGRLVRDAGVPSLGPFFHDRGAALPLQALAGADLLREPKPGAHPHPAIAKRLLARLTSVLFPSEPAPSRHRT